MSDLQLLSLPTDILHMIYEIEKNENDILSELEKKSDKIYEDIYYEFINNDANISFNMIIINIVIKNRWNTRKFIYNNYSYTYKEVMNAILSDDNIVCKIIKLHNLSNQIIKISGKYQMTYKKFLSVLCKKLTKEINNVLYDAIKFIVKNKNVIEQIVQPYYNDNNYEVLNEVLDYVMKNY